MNGNPGEPGRKGGLAGELMQMFISADIGILHYIFCLAIIAQNHPGHTIKPLVVTPHQDLKQSGFTSKYAAYYFFIAKFALGQGPHQSCAHLSPSCTNRVTGKPRVTILSLSGAWQCGDSP